MMRTCAVCLLTLLFASGCTVSVPQWQTVSSLIRSSSELNYQDYQWVLQYRGIDVPVYAVAVEGSIVFSDAADIAVVFDGWSVTKALGFTPGGTLKIDIDDQLYTITDRFRLMQLVCEAWARVDLDGQAEWQWSRSCVNPATGQSYPSLIKMNEQNQIVSIEQVVDPDGNRIRISKR